MGGGLEYLKMLILWKIGKKKRLGNCFRLKEMKKYMIFDRILDLKKNSYKGIGIIGEFGYGLYVR